MFCDSYTIIKNKTEKSYRYIIKIDKPYTLVLFFYDEEKSHDEKNTDLNDQRNKITGLTIYFDNKVKTDYINELVKDFNNFAYIQPISKTFYVISTSIIGGYELRAANIKDFEINLELNYGDSFTDKYFDILDKLKNQKRGLFLFHGDSGTGKCVDGETYVTLRNKKTGEIKNISIDDFDKLI